MSWNKQIIYFRKQWLRLLDLTNYVFIFTYICAKIIKTQLSKSVPQQTDYRFSCFSCKITGYFWMSWSVKYTVNCSYIEINFTWSNSTDWYWLILSYSVSPTFKHSECVWLLHLVKGCFLKAEQELQVYQLHWLRCIQKQGQSLVKSRQKKR